MQNVKLIAKRIRLLAGDGVSVGRVARIHGGTGLYGPAVVLSAAAAGRLTDMAMKSMQQAAEDRARADRLARELFELKLRARVAAGLVGGCAAD